MVNNKVKNQPKTIGLNNEVCKYISSKNNKKFKMYQKYIIYNILLLYLILGPPFNECPEFSIYYNNNNSEKNVNKIENLNSASGTLPFSTHPDDITINELDLEEDDRIIWKLFDDFLGLPYIKNFRIDYNDYDPLLGGYPFPYNTSILESYYLLLECSNQTLFYSSMEVNYTDHLGINRILPSYGGIWYNYSISSKAIVLYPDIHGGMDLNPITDHVFHPEVRNFTVTFDATPLYRVWKDNDICIPWTQWTINATTADVNIDESSPGTTNFELEFIDDEVNFGTDTVIIIVEITEDTTENSDENFSTMFFLTFGFIIMSSIVLAFIVVRRIKRKSQKVGRKEIPFELNSKK